MRIGIIFVLILGFATKNIFAFWSHCTHTNAPGPDSITSAQCNEERCFAVRGETLFADILATPLGAHVELITRITAFVFGVGVNIPVAAPFDNACNNIFKNNVQVQCPTVPGDQYRLEVEMPIPTTIPQFQNSIVRVEFLDRGMIAACGEVLATIV